MKASELIIEMQSLVIRALQELEQEHVYTKQYLGVITYLPTTYLDAVLKDLRADNIIEVDHMMDNCGKFAGSGYKLTEKGLSRAEYLKNIDVYIEKEKSLNNKKSWFKRIFSIFS